MAHVDTTRAGFHTEVDRVSLFLSRKYPKSDTSGARYATESMFLARIGLHPTSSIGFFSVRKRRPSLFFSPRIDEVVFLLLGENGSRPPFFLLAASL